LKYPIYIARSRSELMRFEAFCKGGFDSDKAGELAVESMLEDPEVDLDGTVVAVEYYDGLLRFKRECTHEDCEGGERHYTCSNCGGTGMSRFGSSMSCASCRGVGAADVKCEECDDDGLQECMSDGDSM